METFLNHLKTDLVIDKVLANGRVGHTKYIKKWPAIRRAIFLRYIFLRKLRLSDGQGIDGQDDRKIRTDGQQGG